MKKVLFTSTVDSHILHFHIPFIKLFKDNGYIVHVATNGSDNIPYVDKKYKVSFERSPYKINNIKAFFALKRILNKESYDIIHCNTPMGGVITRLASKKARKNGTGVIYEAHGFHFYKGSPLKYWLIYYPVEWFLSKYTDTLITINEEDYNLALKKFSKRCKDIQYVKGVGINTDKFNIDTNKAKLRKELNIKEDDFVISVIGRIDKNKNQELIIDSMDELTNKIPNIHLLIIGNNELNKELNNLNDNIHILGYRNDINDLLSVTDICVSCSNREGLPVNIMEAMYKGIPIVCSNVRGNRDLVKDNINGLLFEVNDSNKLCDNIVKLYKDKELYNKMSINNKDDIKEYLLDNIIKDMSKIYFKKKKILFLLSSNKYSGAENVVCSIIKNINKDYITCYSSRKGSIQETLESRNIDYKLFNKMNYKNIRKIVKEFNPDIIFASDFKASIIATLFNKKVISQIHKNDLRMNKISIYSIIFNFFSRKINYFIWVSKDSLDDYYYKKNVVNKSIVLRNVIDNKDILIKSNDCVCEKNYDLIFLGRLEKEKNPERLIEIFKLVNEKDRNIKSAIVGDGSYFERVKNLIDKYNLQNSVTLYGYVKNPYPILKNSKILILSSTFEGTPMCVLEALCLGKPVISTPVNGLKEIINDNNGFLSDNNEEITNMIIKILDNKNYLKFSQAALKTFEEINDNIKYYDKIKEIIENENSNSVNSDI